METKVDKSKFVEPKLCLSNMKYYTVRNSILRAVKQNINRFNGKLIDLGCGIMPYREIIISEGRIDEYIGVDLMYSDYHNRVKPDIIWNGFDIPFEDNSIDCLIATEFLEHYHDTGHIFKEIFRVLKKDGLFFATIPFIWNLHESPYDEYRFTPFSLTKYAINNGFSEVEVRPLGGWNYSLAQFLGLWVTHFCHKKSKIIKIIIPRIIYPFYYLLVRSDKVPSEFDNNENSMFNSLSLVALK